MDSPGESLEGVFFQKCARGLKKGSISNEIRVQDGNGTALVEHVEDNLKGIGDLSGFTLDDLNKSFRQHFDDGISK